MKAFIDIDTQIDFVFPAGALYGGGAARLLPAIAKLNAFAAKNSIPLISTTCAHPEDSEEFRVWPPHCVVGTVGQQKPCATLLSKRTVVPNWPITLDVAGVEQILLEKDDLDLFSNPNVPALLDQLGVDEFFVYGVLTEYCVQLAVMGLLERGYRVRLVTDATAALSEAAGEEVIASFVAAGGECVTAASVEDCLRMPV